MEIVKSDAKKNANNLFARLVVITARSSELNWWQRRWFHVTMRCFSLWLGIVKHENRLSKLIYKLFISRLSPQRANICQE